MKLMMLLVLALTAVVRGTQSLADEWDMPVLIDRHAELWVHLEPRWAQRYRISSRLESQLGERTANWLEQKAVILIVIAAVEPDGAAIIRIRIESLQALAQGWGEPLKYPRGEEDPAPAEHEAIKRMFDALGEAVVELRIDPRGHAALISGLDAATTAANASELEGASRLLGIFAPGAVERIVASVLLPDPERRERRIRESWTDSHTIPVLGQNEARITTHYTLDSMRDDVAHVNGEVKVELLEPRRREPTEPRLRLKDQSGSVRVQWDTGNRRLKSRVMETRVVWLSALAAEPEIRSELTVRSRVEIELVEGDE
jgi:hypothetical protein